MPHRHASRVGAGLAREVEYRMMFSRRLAQVLVSATLIVATAFSPAVGDERLSRDGNDANGPLDIAWIKHAHRINSRDVRQLVHTVRLYEPWPVEELRHRGYIHLFFQLAGHRNNPQERTLWITYEDGKLEAKMYSTLGDPPKFLANVTMWRPDPKTVKVAFRKRLLRHREFARYKWGALSFVEERHRLCPGPEDCDDFAPDLRNGKNYVTHRL